jgi:hypothetical protein
MLAHMCPGLDGFEQKLYLYAREGGFISRRHGCAYTCANVGVCSDR